MKNIFNEIIEENNIQLLFQSGLQRMLCHCIIISLSIIKKYDIVPDGLVRELQKNFSDSVSIGTQLDFMIWMSKNIEKTYHLKIHKYFLDNEVKNSGWLKQMLNLRNLYYHPKQLSQDEIITKAKLLVNTHPSFNDWGYYDIKNDEKIYWIEQNQKVFLDFFAIKDDDTVMSLSKIHDNHDFEYENNYISTNLEIKEWISKIRTKDNKLINPSFEDIINKTKVQEKNFYGKEEKWHHRFMRNDKLACFVNTKVADSILSHISNKYNEIYINNFVLQNANDIFDNIKEVLGIATKIDIVQLSKWQKNNSKYIFCIRTEQINSKSLLKVMYWISDLAESKYDISHIKILLQRDEKMLVDDENFLWDKLPDSLDKIFFTPKKTQQHLLDYFWTEETKFSLWKYIFRKYK